MTEHFAPLFFEKFGGHIKSGMSEGTAQEIARFLEMIQVEPQNMLSYVQEQSSTAVRFQGAFFSLLRQVMKETKNVDLKAGILEFIKRYTDMAEGNHTLKQMEQVIARVKEQMFQSGQERLEKMAAQMDFTNAARGGTASNAAVVKEQILPYLNQYIGSTHDRGELRDATVLLAALTARYENGEQTRVQEKFEELLEYPAIHKYFREVKGTDLMRILAATDYEKAVDKNIWLREFADIIRDGMKKGTNVEKKQMFQNIMKAILLNESVYMPLLHLMLPMQVQDKLLFAEMWLDPDEGGSKADREEGRIIKGLVKFDIQGIGFFDLFFICQNRQVNLQLNYPEELQKHEKEIREKITVIVEKNDLECRELYLGNSKESIPLSEAFPKIFERKNSINVKI